MKKNLLIFMLLVLSLNLFSQPTIRVFAFEQENMPGTKPAGVTDENGNPVRKAAAKKNYFIYLSFNKTLNFTPSEIIIKGKSFAIKAISIKKTPVQYINNNIPAKPEKVILVPATKNKVIQLQPGEEQSENKKSISVQRLTGKNDIVIVYLWKNKKYFLSLKKMKKLDPVANE